VGPFGVPEMIFIFVLALLIFGPRKLPELGRTLGKALTEFRRASAEVRLAVEEEMRELDRQTREVARETERAVREAQTDPPARLDPTAPPAADSSRNPDAAETR
jgi:TatA/E family protein of Tat protein translocase